MIFSFKRTLTATALVCASLAVVPADAKTFKWANSGDVSSMDPYARQETFLLTFTQNIYDPLVRRDRNLGLEPALAVKWGQSDPTTWFFDLRQGVKFTDGTPFTAKDVVCTFDLLLGKNENNKLRSNPRASWYTNVESVTADIDRSLARDDSENVSKRVALA